MTTDNKDKVDVKSNETVNLEELKWVTVRKFDQAANAELDDQTFWQKAVSKFSTNPVVPIGVLVTTGVLFNGIYNMFKGNRVKQQKMMRYRVFAQGVTVLAAVSTVLWAPRKNF